jgi:anti-sigma regulatory factor (Ser/Thr protein kinase)
MADAITLTLPRESEYQGVTQLVLAGLAARLDLTLEHLEDLQIAFGALLDPGARGGKAGETVNVQLVVHDDALEAIVGPLSTRVLEALERDAGAELGVKRVLESTVDDVHVDGDSVRLTKRRPSHA